MEKNQGNRTRCQILKQLLCDRLKNEKHLVFIFIVAIVYALISNILMHCEPLNVNFTLLSFMDSFDNLIRNCCYGAIVSILFYFANDYYKNIKSQIDLINEMFPELYEIWWNIFSPLSLVTKNQLDESKGIDSNYQILYNYFNEDEKEKKFHPLNIKQIPLDKFHHLQYTWQTALDNKKKFLEIYGNIINRKEYSQLAYSEYDISMTIINNAIEDIKVLNNREYVCITERYLQRTLYLIVQYESDLSKMINKYSEFFYGDRKRMTKMPNNN